MAVIGLLAWASGGKKIEGGHCAMAALQSAPGLAISWASHCNRNRLPSPPRTVCTVSTNIQESSGVSNLRAQWIEGAIDKAAVHISRRWAAISCAACNGDRLSSPPRTVCTASNALQGTSRASNLLAQSSRNNARMEGAVEEAHEEEEQSAVHISRRWAAIVLPVATALSSIIAFPSGAATTSTEVGIERDVENNEMGRVELRTLSGCGLGVARYPDFVYNAEGGGGSGQTRPLPDGRTHVRFDAEGLYIPAVSFGTTTILGLPLPPGLKIEVVPKTLEGYIEPATGKVELSFLANFNFTAGPLYRAPPLVVDTKLTTESAQGVFRAGKGRRLDSSGNVKLVGVATLGAVNDLFLSTFLTLPTECLAELSANLSFS